MTRAHARASPRAICLERTPARSQRIVARFIVTHIFVPIPLNARKRASASARVYFRHPNPSAYLCEICAHSYGEHTISWESRKSEFRARRRADIMLEFVSVFCVRVCECVEAAARRKTRPPQRLHMITTVCQWSQI